MHNGEKAYSNAIKCINKLNLLEKNLIIISNSSKKKHVISKNLKYFGYNKKHFCKILSSGQVIWEELKNPTLKWIKNLGKNCYHLYSKREKGKNSFFYGLDKNIVSKISEADFILASTVDPSFSTLDYMPILKDAIDKKIPFVCANPDYESVERNKNNEKKICMGTIAKLYEDFGGKVYTLGKPTKFIYEKSVASIVNFNKSRTLAIGDSISHDIVGANNFGIKSLLITSGIHKELFLNKDFSWNSFLDNYTQFHNRPDYICEKLIY